MTHQETTYGQRVVLLGIALLLTTTGCTPAAVLRLGAPPQFPSLPSPPTVPASQSVRAEVAPLVDARVVSARLPGDLRTQTIAVAVEGDEAVGTALTPRFTRALLAAGYTRVLYPTSVQAVNAELERSGAGAGERTVIHGTVRQLLPLRASTPADCLLVISVQSAQRVDRERRVEARYANGALADYDRRYQDFLRVARGTSGGLSSYARESANAFATYQREGGTVVGNTREAELAAAVEAWNTTAASLQSQLRTLVASAPATSQLAARAAAATAGGMEHVSMPVIRLRATLTDLRAGETYWLVDVAAEGTDESAALDGAVGAILASLSAGGNPSSTPPSSSPPPPAPRAR